MPDQNSLINLQYQFSIVNDLNIEIKKSSSNVMEALGNGATEGMKLAANVAAMLVAFISIVAMLNYLLSFLGTSIDQLLGLLFKPLAWSMGVPWKESAMMGTLMGKKIAFTELIAYSDLKIILVSKFL